METRWMTILYHLSVSRSWQFAKSEVSEWMRIPSLLFQAFMRVLIIPLSR